MIKLSSVSKKIRGKQILSDITLELSANCAYLMRGHNGSGKTMLLRLLCDLIKPTDGEVDRADNYSFGIIIERPSFLENETALYNLKYLAGINRKINEDTILQWLDRLNLSNERNLKVNTLSLGMKQRLAICQAVMEDPDILLLDEPFNALDDENYEVVMSLLSKLKKDGKMIVVAAHAMPEDKLTLFDKVITLSNGQVTSIEQVSIAN